MLELKEEREIVRGIVDYLTNKYTDIKEIFIEQNEGKYDIKVETSDNRSIIDTYERDSSKVINSCSILYHIENREVLVNFS